MIQEEYCSFEQAKALKELGFPQDGLCIIDYYTEYSNTWKSPDDTIYYAKPTLSLIQKWLREEYNMYFVALPCVRDIWGDVSKCDYYDWRIAYNGSEPYTGVSDTYEQALSAAIDKCIELLKSNPKISFS